MGNDIYDENKRLKREIEGLHERLRAKEETGALPKLLEDCAIAFFQGRARFNIFYSLYNGWDIRFHVDPSPPQPTEGK